MPARRVKGTSPILVTTLGRTAKTNGKHFDRIASAKLKHEPETAARPKKLKAEKRKKEKEEEEEEEEKCIRERG